MYLIACSRDDDMDLVYCKQGRRGIGPYQNQQTGMEQDYPSRMKHFQ